MVSKERILELARLARLDVQDAEVARLQTELSSIIEYVDSLSRIDTSEADPMSHMHGIHNVWREDRLQQTLNTERYLKNAPASEQGFIKVPLVIE